MAAITMLPFNMMPVNAGNIANAGYTVPAGRYARVIATLSAETRISSGTHLISNIPACHQSGGPAHVQVELWLRAGEVITVSNSAASGTISASGGQVAYNSFSSIAQLLVGGVAVSKAVSPLSLYFFNGSSSTPQNISVTGTTSVNFRYEEFNVLS